MQEFPLGRTALSSFGAKNGFVQRFPKKAKALGNLETGDGSRFRGRGLIHLTGRVGYSAYERYRGRNFTTDTNAQLLSTDAMIATDSAGYFWVGKMMKSINTRALRSGLNIHRRADIGTHNSNIEATVVVTGGKMGLSERQEFFEYIFLSWEIVLKNLKN